MEMQCEEISSNFQLLIFIGMFVISVIVTANWAKTGRK